MKHDPWLHHGPYVLTSTRLKTPVEARPIPSYMTWHPFSHQKPQVIYSNYVKTEKNRQTETRTMSRRETLFQRMESPNARTTPYWLYSTKYPTDPGLFRTIHESSCPREGREKGVRSQRRRRIFLYIFIFSFTDNVYVCSLTSKRVGWDVCERVHVYEIGPESIRSNKVRCLVLQ